VTVPTIIEFVTDPQLLGLSLSPAQEVILRAMYALDATPAQRAIFAELTGRSRWPTARPAEVTVIGGVRGGKDSRILAPVAVYEAVFGGHDAHLARGERAVLPMVYQDMRATRVGSGYVSAYLTGSPVLATLVEDVLATEVKLTNRTSIPGFPATGAALRAWSIPAGFMNEVGSYPIEGMTDADVEIQASIRRGMVAFPQTLLLKVSSPWMKAASCGPTTRPRGAWTIPTGSSSRRRRGS
jgi:hypothetical protein